MIIIKQGKKQDKEEDVSKDIWWVGVQLRCNECECKFELEESDKPILKRGMISRSDDCLHVKCPCCNGLVVTPSFYEIFLERLSPVQFPRYFTLRIQ